MIDRQARDLPLDAHVHTDLSPDSDVPIEANAEAAVERGIAEIAITDHVDFVPDTPAFAYTTFEQRERVVREAAGRWADRGVAIRYGVEITWDSRYAAEIRDHLATHAYDFVIGSVHIYRGSPFAADNIAARVRRPVLRRGDRGRPIGPVRRAGPHRFREALADAARHPRRPRRGPRAV
jgi:histidinol-phosphatase (PHP family)